MQILENLAKSYIDAPQGGAGTPPSENIGSSIVMLLCSYNLSSGNQNDLFPPLGLNIAVGFFLIFFGIFAWIAWSAYYHPHMWVGNVFSCFCLHVWLSFCLSVCLCVCLSVCLSVCPSICLSVCIPVITFEPLHIETSFLVYRYIFTISR